jgi:hypothetical protein
VSTPVESLVVEIDGRSSGVEAAAARASKALGGVTQTATTTAAGAANIGARYSQAAVQVASAAENMARAGKLGGEGLKQIVNQGAQAAFFFGPEGAFIGALAIGLIAVVELFRKTSAESQKLLDQLDADIARREGKQRQQQQAAIDARQSQLREEIAALRGRQFTPDAKTGLDTGAAGAIAKLKELEAELAKTKAQQAELSNQIGDDQEAALGRLVQSGKASREEFERAAAIVAQLKKDLAALPSTPENAVPRAAINSRIDALTPKKKDDSPDNAVRALREELATLAASLTTKNPLDDIAAKFDALAAKVRALKGQPKAVIDELTASVESLRVAAIAVEQAKIEKIVDTIAIQESATLTDDLRQKFDDLLATLEKAPNADAFRAQIDALRAMGDASVSAQARLEGVAEAFDQFKADVPAGGVQIFDPDALERAGAMSVTLQDIVDDETVANEVRERAKTLLAEIAKRYAEIGGNLFKIPDATEKVNKGLSATVSNLFGAVEAAIQLAGAMGKVDEETAHALATALRLAKSITEVIATKGKKGIPDAIAQAIELAQTIFGKNPAAEQRAKELVENSRQLAKLNQNVGDLIGLDLSGKQLGNVRKGTEALLAATGDAGGFRRFGDKGPLRDQDPKQFFEKLGIPFEDVQKVADRLGITLNGTKQSFIDLHNAIIKADLEVFFNTFEGQLAKLEANDRIHGITDPLEQFIEKAELLAKTSPLFAKIFEGLDLRTLEGRAEAARRLREQWDKFMADPEAFRQALEESGLSLEQWRDQMLEVNDALTKAADAAARLSDALSEVDLDLAIEGNTNPVTAATRKAQAAAKEDARFAPLTGLNLGTAEGRASAENFLKALASGASDELKQVILQLLESIRAIPSEIGDAVDGETKVVTSNAQGLLEVTGNRMADYLRVGNLLLREILAAIRGRGELGALPPLTPPNIPLAGNPVAGSFAVTFSKDAIVVNAPPGVITDQKSFTDFLSGPLPTAFVRKISEGLSVEAKAVAKAQGIVRVTG